MRHIIAPLCFVLALSACEKTEDEASNKPLQQAPMDSGEDVDEPQIIAESWKGWIDEFHRVDAVLYDYSVEQGSLVQKGRLHKGVVAALTKTLTGEELARLEKLVTGSNHNGGAAGCYMPHHGFVFYDKNGGILGHLELCLMCGNYFAKPRKGLSDVWDLEGIKKLLKDMGLPVLGHPDKWEAFFKEQRQSPDLDAE